MDLHLHHHLPQPLWDTQQDSAAAELSELRQALLRVTAELDSTRAAAREELVRMESQALHLAHLLDAVTRERDELRRHCHSLLLLLVDPSPPPPPPPLPNPNPNPSTGQLNPVQPAIAVDEGSNVEEEEEEGSNGTSSPPPLPPPVAAPPPSVEAEMEAAARRRGLPEKGRLVEAVVAAGPLLQTLLLAGPLPRWRHPPPAMGSFEIPPFNPNPSPNSNPKREREEGDSAMVTGFCAGSLSPPPTPLRNSTSSSPESNCSGRQFYHNNSSNNNISPFHL